MKIWKGFSSEHSMNLVMIGRFMDAGDAAKAKQVIDWLTEQVDAEVEAGLMKIGEPADRYTNSMLELLRKTNITNIGSTELEQFAYDVTIKIEETQVVVTTDEIEVSAFLKVLLDMGARVEVYSAHDYHGTGYGRGK
ncbi:MAG: hypothetical protein A2W36_04320 [Chloroflexi bacterium RBG_16_58_14]|nr:MAG: hypothetical protein A2W36_04320 [Chloroflexi bacterium RBG_16_58_14]